MSQPERFATILDERHGLTAGEQAAMRERLALGERLEIDVLVEVMVRTAEAEGRVYYRPDDNSGATVNIGFDYLAVQSLPGPGGPQTVEERLQAVAIERAGGTQIIITLTQARFLADGSQRHSLECDMSVQPGRVVIDDF